MSDTPRTDAAAHGFVQANPQKTDVDMWGIECVDADFARGLERELAAWKALCESNRLMLDSKIEAARPEVGEIERLVLKAEECTFACEGVSIGYWLEMCNEDRDAWDALLERARSSMNSCKE